MEGERSLHQKNSLRRTNFSFGLYGENSVRDGYQIERE